MTFADRTAARRRTLRASGAVLLAALALSACGGGGGSTSSSAPAGSSAGPESTYLLAEFVAQTTSHQFVHVWDPARPAATVEDVPIVPTNGIVWTSSHLVYADAVSYDPSTRTRTTLGHARVFFDSNGALYTIDLRGGQSHAPVQLSSATDVTGVAQAIALDAAGADVWVQARGASHDWAIRTNMAATDAPQPVQALAAMRDLATGLPQYLFARFGAQQGFHVVPSSFGVRDLAFNAVPVPAVDAMGASDAWLAADPAQPGLAYLSIGGQVRALRWSAQGVGVDAAALYTGAVASGPTPVADASAVYFTDGDALLAAANAAVTPVGQFTGAITALTDAGDGVVATELTSMGQQWERLPKAGGPAVTLATGGSTMSLVGASAAGMLFQNPSQPVAAYALLDAAGHVLQQAAGLPGGLVVAAAGRPDQPPVPVAVLTCTTDSARSQCVPGPVTQLDLSSGTGVTLGTLTTVAASLSGQLVQGLTGPLAAQTVLTGVAGFGAGDVSQRDSWQIVPGSAGSLQRITNYLP